MSLLKAMDVAVAVEKVGLTAELEEELSGVQFSSRGGVNALEFSMCVLAFERELKRGGWIWKAGILLTEARILSDLQAEQIIRVTDLKGKVLRILNEPADE